MEIVMEATEMALELLGVHQAVVAATQVSRLHPKSRLESVEIIEDKEIKAIWYFPPGGIFKKRGLEIESDERLPKEVKVVLDGKDVVLPVRHFRAEAI